MRLQTRLVVTLGVVGATVPWLWTRYASAGRTAPTVLAQALSQRPAVVAPPAAPQPIVGPVEGLEPRRMRFHAGLGHFVSGLPQGRRAVLTLEPAWQRGTVALMARHEIPRASVVVLDTDTGRVRVYASHGGDGGDLARNVEPPAASVFKIVTASALLQHGLGERETTCWSGGFHGLTMRELIADPRRDRECSTIGEAFARSINTVFARRALEFLRPDTVAQSARAWGFGEEVPFDVRVAPSGYNIPSETLPFARTAAGFWNSHLSPLHGALLAQGIALNGQMLRPWIVERVEAAGGQTLQVGGMRPWRRSVPPEVAQALGRAMLRTVHDGTARTSFHDPSGRAYLPDVVVGGKTGTLTGRDPNSAYTWFVGNAEGAGRRLSIAVMVANGPLWRVRALTLARQVLQVVFRGRSSD